MRPNSSPATAKMKSACASGRHHLDRALARAAAEQAAVAGTPRARARSGRVAGAGSRKLVDALAARGEARSRRRPGRRRRGPRAATTQRQGSPATKNCAEPDGGDDRGHADVGLLQQQRPPRGRRQRWRSGCRARRCSLHLEREHARPRRSRRPASGTPRAAARRPDRDPAPRALDLGAVRTGSARVRPRNTQEQHARRARRTCAGDSSETPISSAKAAGSST